MPQAERRQHQPFVVERRQQHVPRPPGLAEDQVVRHEHVGQPDLAGAHRPHPELGDLGDPDPVGVGRDEEQGDALVSLFDVAIGPREQQDVVGDVRGAHQVLLPLRTQPPSALVGRVRMPPSRSVPPPGSVKPIAKRSSPRAIAGRKRCFCSSVP